MFTESPVETIAIDAATRLIVRYDHDAESPLSWGDHVTRDSPEYQRWQEGDVYGVILERARIFTADNGDTLTVWEKSESIWGCYLDADYTARTVAAEYWSVTA